MLLRRIRAHQSLSTAPITGGESTTSESKDLKKVPTTTTTPQSQNDYLPRTQALYSLPAHYSQRLRWIRTHGRQPWFVREGTYTSRHSGQAELHTVRPPRSEGRSLQDWCSQLSEDAPWLISDRLHEELMAFTRTASTPTEAPLRDFNRSLVGFYEETFAARRASLHEVERRMFRRLIAGIVPVAGTFRGSSMAEGKEKWKKNKAKTEEEEKEEEDSDGLAVTGVLDDGHLDSAILWCGGRLLRSHTTASGPDDDSDKTKGEEKGRGVWGESPAGVALLVKPFAQEVCSLSATTVGGVHNVGIDDDRWRWRTLPRGREWDRQRAIRNAAGATAQEAIIDLKIDPRYRRPGEYVRWRYNKTNRSMEVVP
ncbi:unnamed protein product [Phytomonas sp. Hart1]|nr:unnamed protein product [Phytomonas sp. Hart1]|eukprot:CCW67531.1 unnamed protein product [Phytomonas sp. isolate Hart1]